MTPFKTTLLLSFTLITGAFTNDLKLDNLPSEVLGQIGQKLAPTDLANLNMTGDKLLTQKSKQYMDKFIDDIIRKSNDPQAAKTLYDALPIDKTNPRGIYNLINHADFLLTIPKFQIPPIIDFLVSIKISKAIGMKCDGLKNGWYGYDSDPTAAHALVEKHANLGDQWALETKIIGLDIGWYGYDSDPTAAHALIEEQIKLDNQWAIQRKFEGLAFREYGYDSDPTAAHALVEKHANLGNLWAIELKYDGLVSGHYGYDSDPTAAHALVEKHANLGNLWAIQKKYDELVSGGNSYTKAPTAARALIEEQIKLDNQWAIQTQIRILLNGSHGYAKAPEKAYNLIQSVYGIKLINAG